MYRACSHCGKPFSASDLCKDVSKRLEAQRMALGVEGVLFRVYNCSRCNRDDLFVDVCSVPGESAEEYRARKDGLEDLIQDLPMTEADVVLAERPVAQCHAWRPAGAAIEKSEMGVPHGTIHGNSGPG